MTENQGQSAENSTETNSTSNAAENSEPMQVLDGTAAADETAGVSGTVAEASGTSDSERREMVNINIIFL